MAKLSALLRSTTALAFGATLAVSPLALSATTLLGLGLTFGNAAFAKADSGDNRGRGGGDERDDDDRRGGGREVEADDDRGRGRGGDDANEVRGRELKPGDDRGGLRNRDVRLAEPGDDRNRGLGNPPLVGEGFANHGDRVSTLVAIAKALGYEAEVGANQANFGTPQERGLAPADRATDWQTANLDVNRDGVVNAKDLDAVPAR